MKSNSNLAVNVVLAVLVTTVLTLASCSKDNLVPAAEHGTKPVSTTQLTDESGGRVIPVRWDSTTPVKSTHLITDVTPASAIVPVGEKHTVPVKATPLKEYPANAIIPVNERSTEPVNTTQLTNEGDNGNGVTPVGVHGTAPVKSTQLITGVTPASAIIPFGEKSTTAVKNTFLINDAGNGITVSPNPTTGPITVKFTEPLAENYTIQVLSMQKVPLMSKSGVSVAGNNNVNMNLTSLGKGNYILSFHSSDQNQVVEVSVQYP